VTIIPTLLPLAGAATDTIRGAGAGAGAGVVAGLGAGLETGATCTGFGATVRVETGTARTGFGTAACVDLGAEVDAILCRLLAITVVLAPNTNKSCFPLASDNLII